MPTAATTTVRSAIAADFDSYSDWRADELDAIALAKGTNLIRSLTSTATAWDQGWGGQTGDNGLRLSLVVGTSRVWQATVASASHGARTIDFTAGVDQLAGLNSALAAVGFGLLGATMRRRKTVVRYAA